MKCKVQEAKSSLKNLVRQRYAERFNSGVKGLNKARYFTQDNLKALKKRVLLTRIIYCKAVKISLNCIGAVIWFSRSAVQD
jgi:hypothetical protein